MARQTLTARLKPELVEGIRALAAARGSTESETTEALLEQALRAEFSAAALRRAREEAWAAAEENVADRLRAVEGILQASRDRLAELRAEEDRLQTQADEIRLQASGVGTEAIGTLASRLRELDDGLALVRNLRAGVEGRVQEAQREKESLETERRTVFARAFEQRARDILQAEADRVAERIVLFQEAVLRVLDELYVLPPGTKRIILRQLDSYLSSRAAGLSQDQDVIAHHVNRDFGFGQSLREWSSAWAIFHERGRPRTTPTKT